ncbi:hypothetical protein ACYUJ6_03420 [Clostridium sp. JNZ X4-2]
MYPYIHPEMEMMPMCCYCRMNSRIMNRPVMPRKYKSMFRNEEPEENRMDNESTVSPVQHMPDMGQGQEMQDMTKNISEADRERIRTDTQEIVKMFECHHPELLTTLTNCSMSITQARQYLSRVVSMALMYHMIHNR